MSLIAELKRCNVLRMAGLCRVGASLITPIAPQTAQRTKENGR